MPAWEWAFSPAVYAHFFNTGLVFEDDNAINEIDCL